jgi:ABC-type transporter Mla subunit MlaD
MTDDVFRIVVTVGVVLAALAFVVQAGIMLALYKVTRKATENAERFTGRIEPIMTKIEPALDKAGVVMEQAGPVIERLVPVIAKAGATIDQIGPVLDKAVPMIERVGPVIDEVRSVVAKTGVFVQRATELTASANLVIEDVRPRVVQISNEAVEMTRMGREQVERVGDLLHEAGDKARTRLDQIDHSVEATIEQVEHVSGAMKRAVMMPVREVNGLAAGISAAVSTLVRGQRNRHNVDSATQDEEMFI